MTEIRDRLTRLEALLFEADNEDDRRHFERLIEDLIWEANLPGANTYR